MTSTTTAKIILDSVSPTGARITTMQLKYPRFIHAEAKTHRIMNITDNAYALLEETGLMDCKDLSRNASSSRAIPVAKIIAQVRTDPAMPIHWGRNKPGMQAETEIEDTSEAKALWVKAAIWAADVAEEMNALGLHKQVVNRILEPFQWMHVIVTATEWDNFFKLRYHDMADPNIYELAKVMLKAKDESTPVERDFHVPYVDDAEDLDAGMLSAARCARVSYLNHDGSTPDKEKDLALANMLLESGHASPFEHIAKSSSSPTGKFANFTGWQSLRNYIDL